MHKIRAKAIVAGDKFYNTGKKCLNGHKSNRLTVDGSCYQCRLEAQKKKRAEIRKAVS